ncbi:MFS transporter [Shumkonia mesophila]|uniref:MFS transporter n=1 Tax=Shumkonia mesophila TaxID=2838854 RepID=UPI00293497D0|nr:MFS transporter [Shumkonia mesophila]
MADAVPQEDGRGASPRALLSWCLYDWANSAFPTVITTFVFAAYFTRAVAADEVAGTSQWGAAMSLSGLAIALAGPVLGAIADRGGRRKPWIAAFTALCVALTALLWFARPDPSFALYTLVLVASANFAFEMGGVFYNAMLPGLAAEGRLGRLSGWAWGVGYAGGLACLVVALVGFVQAENPLFGLDRDAAEHVRATAPLVALWFALFSLPLFLWTPDVPATGVGLIEAARRGVATLAGTLRRVGEYRMVARFLLAHMIYADGLNTLFAFGGIYAAGTFGMEFADIIVFGIGLNVTAGLGAALFAWADDAVGPKRTILVAVAGLAGFGAVLVLIDSVTLFWIFGLGLGVFVGPAQAASRSFMARLAPPHLRAEMFGLYALAGKATAFVGPALLAWVTAASGSQRWGMATILGFFVIGGLLLLAVKEPANRRDPVTPQGSPGAFP